MKFKRILLDMDEVLCDFLGAFSDYYDHDVEGLTGWKIHSHVGITEEEFDKQLNDLGAGFWANLKLRDDARELVKNFQTLYMPIYVVSSPTENPGSWSGKKAWLSKHFPKLPLVLTQHKHLMATDKAVLIDDSPYNVDAFRKMGGAAYCYPHIWNEARAHVGNEITYLMKQLRD